MPTRASMSEEPDIQWGTVKNFNQAKIFYNNFISEGVVYELFDNVEVYNGEPEDHADPYIGKIVKLWEEKESGMRKVLLRWYFKLKDLDQEKEGDPRELYLAFGQGKGVTNENDLEVICGKCKVLCTSKDSRNRLPSARDLKNADYFFSKIYNVDLQHLSPVHRVVNKLGCEAVYNKPEWVTDTSKSKVKAVEQITSLDCKRGSSTMQEAQCVGDSPSDLKDRQRDSDIITDMQQKACRASDLKSQQTISDTQEMACQGSDLKRQQTSIITDTQEKTCQQSALKREQSSSMNEACRVSGLKRQQTSYIIDSQEKACEGSDPKRQKTSSIIDTQEKACQGSALKGQQTFSMNEACQVSDLKMQQTSNIISTQEKACQGSDLKRQQMSSIIDTQEKACQGSALKRQQTSSMNEVPQSKKLKALASTSPSTKVKAAKRILKSQNVPSLDEVAASKKTPTLVATTGNKIQKSENVSSLDEIVANKIPTSVATTANRMQKPENVSTFGETVASKIPTSGDLVGPCTKVEQEEQNKKNLPACVPPKVNLKTSIPERSLPLGKILVSETASPKVNDTLGGQAVANLGSSKQLDRKGRADPNVTKATCIDASKVKEDTTEGQTSSLMQARSASSLLEQETEKNPHEKSETNSSASNLRVEGDIKGTVTQDHKVGISLERKSHQAKGDSSSLPELVKCFRESVVKEVRSDVTKKPILSTGPDSEKKSSSTTEPARVVENRKIFKALPWEENLQQEILSERVLLLQNLDPSLTSVDVCDMLKNILQGVSDARMIPQETSCPHGQALVIFDSRLLADYALQEMEQKCLVVENNKRPIIASKFREATNFSRFPGHLALEKLKLSRNLGADEYKKAVSTSHCSQPNTIEYEMAMEWRRLQEIIQTCRAELFEKQRKEMEQIRNGGSSEGH